MTLLTSWCFPPVINHLYISGQSQDSTLPCSHQGTTAGYTDRPVQVWLLEGMEQSCSECDFSLLQFHFKYFGKPRELFDLCVSHKLILDKKDCEQCGKPASLHFDRKLWRCQKWVAKQKKKKAKCNWSQSVYKGTFFDKAHLDLESVLLFVNIYLRECFSFVFVRNELQLSDPTIVDWASFCREVLIEWCLKQTGKIGGHNKIVEIDESKFGKRKYNVGRLIEGQWVFGGICRETRACFMVPVDKRDSETLLAVIEERIEPGTTIISDCWKAYNCLEEKGYKHLTVNHSVNFVDPTTLAHTNNIERLWREAKSKVPLYGRRRKHFAGYLARSMFLMAEKNQNKRFHRFLEEVAALYNPYTAAV